MYSRPHCLARAAPGAKAKTGSSTIWPCGAPNRHFVKYSFVLKWPLFKNKNSGSSNSNAYLMVWACLGSSGGTLRETCQSFGRHWTGPWNQLWSGSGGLWTVLMSSEEVWAVLDGSGRRWTALDGLGSFEWQPGACSQLAESQKSCSYQWWEAYFVKSMLYIAEACSFAKVIDFE